MDWSPVPEPVTWTLRQAVAFNGMSYSTITLRAPSAADVLKATAIPGQSGLDATLRLIAAVSSEGVPYEAVKDLPHWQIDQMSSYMDEFTGAPAPDPLDAWRKARLDARLAETARDS